MAETAEYDVSIIGAGPAGLAAALYTARDRYRTLILDKNGLPGGQIVLTERVENYPGIVRISGPDLIGDMARQVANFGTEVTAGEEATGLRRAGAALEIEINGGEKMYRSRAAILAPGSDYRRLNVPGEEQMRQATKVSYCATCDGAFYRGKHVLCVGGGNTAVEDTLYLAERFVGKATLIHRREEFRAQQVLVEELRGQATAGRVELKLPYVLKEIVGTANGEEIDHVTIEHARTGQTEQLHVDGVFIFVGMVPNTRWLRGVVELTEGGYIRCDCATLQTSMPGVFVAGDCRFGAAMQLVTACADGVIAAMMLKQYFRNPTDWASESVVRLGGGGW